MMTVTLVLGVSVVLQYTASVLALRLIRITGKWPAWTFVAVAIFLMAVRRSITMYRLVADDASLRPDLTAECVALVISALMVAGLAWISPLFQSMRRSHEALRESKERFRLLYERSPLSYQSLDVAGRLIEVNPAWLATLGYSREEVIGRWFGDFLAPGHQERFEENFSRFKVAGETHGVQFAMVRKDGSRVHVEFDGRIAYDEEGRFQQTHCVMHDITARKQAEEELARYRDHLEELVQERTSELEQSREQLQRSERLASIGTLAAGIAHEINNPVGMMLLSAQTALRWKGRPDAGEVTERSLDIIIKQARRCGRIIQSVLQFARQEPTEKWRGDLNATVKRSVHLARDYADERHAVVEVTLGDRLPPVMLNPMQMEQVVVNLIRHAVEAKEEGARVAVCTEQAPEGVRLIIQDNGRGITNEQKKHLFDPFYTKRLQKGGTGLGLSIVHGIITEHGGTISVEGEPGRGTTFTIELPCEPTEREEMTDVKSTGP